MVADDRIVDFLRALVDSVDLVYRYVQIEEDLLTSENPEIFGVVLDEQEITDSIVDTVDVSETEMAIEEMDVLGVAICIMNLVENDVSVVELEIVVTFEELMAEDSNGSIKVRGTKDFDGVVLETDGISTVSAVRGFGIMVVVVVDSVFELAGSTVVN